MKDFKVALVSFFITDFSLLSCKLENSKVLYGAILYWYYSDAK